MGCWLVVGWWLVGPCLVGGWSVVGVHWWLLVVVCRFWSGSSLVVVGRWSFVVGR